MSDNRISELASELNTEGEDDIAAILHFVAALWAINDKAGLSILACFAEKLCAQKLWSNRETEEQIAIAEMMKQL